MLNKHKLLALFAALATLLGLTAPAIAAAEQQAQGNDICKSVPYAPPAAGVTPFTTQPFRERDALGSLVATQGWIVSPDEEQFVDGPGEHRAIDYEFHNRADKGFGVRVLVPNDACIYYSFQAFVCDNLHNDKRVGCSAGLFAEMITDSGWVVQIAHLDQVNPKIPYLAAEPDGPHGWFPAGAVTKSSTVLKTLGVRMKAGELLGLMGDTGITYGYYDNFQVIDGRGVVLPRDRQAFPNWEEGYAQAHIAYYGGRAEGGAHQRNTDPFGWYGQISPSLDQYNGTCPGRFKFDTDTLYKTRHGKVLYARR
ncbi:MAG TPA: hypothetical protein VFZ58_01540 [Candidatus Saccharimonadales bacterium]